jgi:hypothetical protein
MRRWLQGLGHTGTSLLGFVVVVGLAELAGLLTGLFVTENPWLVLAACAAGGIAGLGALEVLYRVVDGEWVSWRDPR